MIPAPFNMPRSRLPGWFVPLACGVIQFLNWTQQASGGCQPTEDAYSRQSPGSVTSIASFDCSEPARTGTVVSSEGLHPPLAGTAESSKALTKDEAAAAVSALWTARLEFLRKDRRAETDTRELVIGELKMPFWYKVFGDAPANGRSLFISMHGGGGAPAEVNDRQYENQKQLYEPEEGVYLVPRAATNTWDLWHQSHIDQFFDRLITNMIVFENVNPDRVYLMGYSAGGDGVYQLAPRLADRLAAAAMMAGHPNESRPEGLRNIGFALHMGALDSAYNRNSVAKEWGIRLDDLQAADPGGYVHEVVLHEGRGHWMNREDAVAVPWMAKFDRNPWPKKIVWVQDDVIHPRFYWLKLDAEASDSPNSSDGTGTGIAKAGDEIVASTDGNTIRIEKCTARRLRLLLSDELLNLDEPVTVILPDGSQTTHHAVRTIATIAESLRDRNDPVAVPFAEIIVDVSTDP